MFDQFPDFVPQNICLSCQGCCRFQNAASIWRPKVSEEEISLVQKRRKDFQNIYSSASVDSQHFVKAYEIPKPHQFPAECQCGFFDIEKNVCRIYQDRPFDCRLYPFLLLKKGRDIFLAVHLNCPYIEQTRYQKIFADQLTKLKDYFSGKDILEFLRRNQFLAGEYLEFLHEIDILFKLEIVS